MSSGIYCIKNKINNKIYVGSSNKILHRFSQHKYKLRKKCHRSLSVKETSWACPEEEFTVFL